jgi:hypothetical protein
MSFEDLDLPFCTRQNELIDDQTLNEAPFGRIDT